MRYIQDSGDSPATYSLRELVGQIDIYLFDQILRGRVTPGMTILDAGCGAGRNLVYFLRQARADGYRVFGADADENAIHAVQRLAGTTDSGMPPDHFRCEPVEAMTFGEHCADFVISSAVLHFARSDEHFAAMLQGTWRVLKPGGLFFCRLASDIGIENRVKKIHGRRYLLPDGSERYLVNEAMLDAWTERVGGSFADPLKTSVVRDQRSMTTWVLRKGGVELSA